MGLYHFQCPVCEKTKRKLFKSEPGDLILCECGHVMLRIMQPPTTRVVEILDNGLMPRKIERLSEAERFSKERSKNNSDK